MLGGANQLETCVLCAFAVAVLFQPLIYAYAGERIVDDSFAVASTIYAAAWHEKCASDQKLIKFCLMRAQKPLILTAPFYDVNLGTFGAVRLQ